jgi:hypothetical protein
MGVEMSETEVVRIAQQACAERDLPWLEPYRVKRGWRWWKVMTPSKRKGGNSIIYVHRRTGTAKVRHYDR